MNCGQMRITTDLMINAPSSVMRSDKILPKFYFDKNYGKSGKTDLEEYYFPFGCRCSVFQAEIYAILQCVKLYSLHCRNSVVSCSDSQAALKALITPKLNSALVAETVCALAELSVHNSVRLVWTPGHCGILGNEMADGLSRQASATK